MPELSDVELDEMQQRCDTATAGPWFIRVLDDAHAMTLYAVSTKPDTNQGERWPDFEQWTMVAATLVQEPRYVSIEDERWVENARFIAHARSDVPRLVAEVRRLRALATGDQAAT